MVWQKKNVGMYYIRAEDAEREYQILERHIEQFVFLPGRFHESAEDK